MKLYDIMRLVKDPYYEADAVDAEFSRSVRVPSFAHTFNSVPTTTFCTFAEELTKKVRVMNISKDDTLSVNWSKLIDKNMDKFRAFAEEIWVADLIEDDECEFIIQWIDAFDSFMAGLRTDKYYQMLLEFVQSLDSV